MGTNNPTLSKSQKKGKRKKLIIFQNFGQLAFFNLLFSAFLKKKELKHNKHINNQNQEHFFFKY